MSRRTKKHLYHEFTSVIIHHLFSIILPHFLLLNSQVENQHRYNFTCHSTGRTIFVTFWFYGPGELPLSYKSSESKGHQTNNNKTNCNNGYHSCTVSNIKTLRNFSVKSFNPAVISDIKINGKSLISATGFNSFHCSRFQCHHAKLLKYVMY